jgi:hypothetical protein
MKLYRIVKGESEIVDYDEETALKMLALNPDRYKRVEDFKVEPKIEKKSKIEKKEEIEEFKIENIDESEIIDSEE